MKAARNRERVLEASVELFNQSGVVAVTTNHIADHLNISPGNLYFHFRNKEQIVAELFDRMCAETYVAWKPGVASEPGGRASAASPLAFVQSSFELYWRYRFFHREMYHMRRKDPELARKWRAHLRKTMRLLHACYAHWTKDGLMKKVADPGELRMITDTVLISSSWFLQFFESKEKPASRRALKQGIEHVARILLPYCTEAAAQEIREHLGGRAAKVEARAATSADLRIPAAPLAAAKAEAKSDDDADVLPVPPLARQERTLAHGSAAR